MWDYLPEKREAVLKWESYFAEILSTEGPAESVLPWPAEQLVRLHAAMRGVGWRASRQASHEQDWIGRAVAEALGYRRAGDWESRVWPRVKELARRGVIARSLVKDKKHRDVPVFSFSVDVARALGIELSGLPKFTQSRGSIEPGIQVFPPGSLAREMAGQKWRAAPQAQSHSDWIGVPIAAALKIPKGEGWKRRCVRIAYALARDGVLANATMLDQVGRVIPAYTLAVAHEVGV
jgi:hypothetical protein